ncbi:type VI secretion system baseplate subunit TssK [Janthinobacterium sp. SUN026]|uniref:type VI secretion system baseplate subunit TssK n=1 Tax=Janthinobacterium sp. SUN026 TaxID=3002438 RepID=UPI0025B0F7E6|nr:type VI secretion system baseplate subunit TssK [Janthinobacterium sp. SUN026]MDN2670940.1 type VI secretion system baseplate subunit TssK [Janthinobacterium sp. SUN026]
MGMAAKILWGEGLFLRPQHFQRQDQYHEARLHHTASALHPYLWGVAHMEWDLAALKTGTLRLQALSAIFRDGEVFEALGDGATGSDTLPPPVDLEALPPAVQEVTYYAALPILNGEGMNYTAQASTAGTPAATRFAHALRATPDLFTESAVADVAYLKKSVRLIPDSEARGSYDCLPLIALRRTVSGGFEPVPSFMAPSLAIAGAPRLRGVLEHLLDALQAKVSALHGHHREPSRNVIEFRSGDVSSFWLLHTASTAAAALMHYVRHPALHPERLYEALLGLAGGLLSYSKHYTLASLPAYDHAQPGACFDAIDGIIRELLDTVISSKYFSIALLEEQPSYYLGKLDSGKIDQHTTLYLAIRAAMPAIELVDVVPLRVKVGAPDDVEKCVLTAMPGLKLSHAPQVPAAIPVRPDTYYFAIENRGALYEQMLKAQSISVYVPAGIRDLQLELIAVTA